jgi:hypothetical protein
MRMTASWFGHSWKGPPNIRLWRRSFVVPSSRAPLGSFASRRERSQCSESLQTKISKLRTTPDNRLADPEQLIADLQRQLSGCKAERDEALQRKAASAEVLQVINSSPENLAPIFDAVLEKALRVCSGTFGTRASFDNGRFARVLARGLPEAYDKWRLEHPFPGEHSRSRPGRCWRLGATAVGRGWPCRWTAALTAAPDDIGMG